MLFCVFGMTFSKGVDDNARKKQVCLSTLLFMVISCDIMSRFWFVYMSLVWCVPGNLFK